MTVDRRRWVVVVVAAFALLTAARATRAQPGPGPGRQWGPPTPDGDPTNGQDPLDELIQPLADLNLRPDFTLTADQKQKVAAIRQSFGQRMTDWRKAHAPDFAAMVKAWDDLRNGRPRPGGDRNTSVWLQLREQRQRLLATAPDPTDAQVQIEAVLTDEQRRRYDATTDGDNLANGSGPNATPFGSVVLPLPEDGVPKAPGFYKLRFSAKVPTADGTRTMRMTYVVFLPRSYDPAKGPYPTLVFLHGSGEAGIDGNGIFAAGLGPAAAIRQRAGTAFAKDFPMILVCPQCPPRGERWDQTPVLRAALQVLDDAQAKVKIDPDRVYVTGLSMGGKGTWLLAGQDPGRFAAIVPICASTLDLPLAARLKDATIWAIDGAEDMEDGAEHNRQMVQAAHDAGGDATATILPHRGHDVWGDYYNDPKFYRWFLDHHRLSAAERAARVPPTTQTLR